MKDKTLIMTGSAASALCFGLIDTGKFMRVRLSATEFTKILHDKFFAEDGENAQKTGTQTRDKRDVDKKESQDDQDNFQKPPYPHSGKYTNSPDVENMSDAYAVRGGEDMVSTVIAVLKSHQREFRVSEDGETIRVECVGSLSRTNQALEEIRASL